MSKDSPYLNWIMEFILPLTLETFESDSYNIVQQIIGDHLQRKSLPQIIESDNQRVGIVFFCKIQEGVIVIEKLYITYVYLIYKQELKIASKLIPYIINTEEQKAKKKGEYSKLRKILWIFRLNINHLEYHLLKVMDFRYVKNLSRTNTYKMYKLNVSNALYDSRVDIINSKVTYDKQGNVLKQEYSPKKLIIKEQLEEKIVEFKSIYSPHIFKANQSQQSSVERNQDLTRLKTIKTNQSHQMFKSPSLPSLKSLRNNIALNNNNSSMQSLLSIQNSEQIESNNVLMKWQFKPTIQEKFKIALKAHKNKFDLLQKEKEKHSRYIDDKNDDKSSYLTKEINQSVKNLFSPKTQSLSIIPNINPSIQSPIDSPELKDKYLTMKNHKAFHSHKPSYQSYISNEGGNFQMDPNFLKQSQLTNSIKE